MTTQQNPKDIVTLTIGDAIRLHEARNEGIVGVRRVLQHACQYRTIEDRAIWESPEFDLASPLWDVGMPWVVAQTKFCDLVQLDIKGRKGNPLLAEARRGLIELDVRYTYMSPAVLADKLDLVYIGLVKLHVDHPAKILVIENHESLWLGQMEVRVAEAA